MSVQDKVERILKEIHILFSESQEVSGETDKIIVNKKEVFSLLEKLNHSMYEVMESYEATERSRELSRRRNEKKSEKIVERANNKVEDIYAAALIYTEDALGRAQKIMSEAAASTQQIFEKMNKEFKEEKERVRGNQAELREQLQDFKDTNKYLEIIEDCNRQREKEQKEKKGQVTEKRIQNESKHYAINGQPEIKVNPAYLVRRGIMDGENTPEENTLWKDSPGENSPGKDTEGKTSPGADRMPAFLEEEQTISTDKLEIKVDLDAEYFKWRAEETAAGAEEAKPVTEKRERRFLFGKK